MFEELLAESKALADAGDIPGALDKFEALKDYAFRDEQHLAADEWSEALKKLKEIHAASLFDGDGADDKAESAGTSGADQTSKDVATVANKTVVSGPPDDLRTLLSTRRKMVGVAVPATVKPVVVTDPIPVARQPEPEPVAPPAVAPAPPPGPAPKPAEALAAPPTKAAEVVAALPAAASAPQAWRDPHFEALMAREAEAKD